MLGEHGERDHGIFLYASSLDVPLLLAGPGIPRARTIDTTVPARALAATLMRLAGIQGSTLGESLPGLGTAPAGPSRGVAPERAVYSETLLPATAYGWSGLKAVTEGRLRFIEAPRHELYDLAADPAEGRNLADEKPIEVARMRALLRQLEGAHPAREADAVVPDAAVSETLRSLGYLSGASAGAPLARGGGIDPKDGIALLAEFDRAKALIGDGRAVEARTLLEDLVRRNPENVPFLSRLAEAEAASGRREAALATLRSASQLNPSLDFLHLHMANGLFELGRLAEARAEYEATLALDPRSARAWLGLGEVALRQGRPDEELKLMQQAVAAGTESALVLSRLAQIELARGQLAEAEEHAAKAVRLLPSFAPGWWVWGQAAEKRGARNQAASRFTRAVEQGLTTPAALVHLGRLLLQLGRPGEARPHLQQVARAGGPQAREARRLLEAQP
jgi:predicted Zn-dependent protease